MDSFLNPDRPPVFCPGCSHKRSLKALNQAFRNLGLAKKDLVLVSDIGCSGLFDTFFNTHALHGLHGRALTYATGIKLSNPDLTVIVTMGDGGLGIGGAHLLAACRRNLDLTLLVLNNFNFGMTGGQFSCTTPATASTASSFLSEIEKPIDVCTVVAAAGAPFVARASANRKSLLELLEQAITYKGFAIVDIQGLCTGRYLKSNSLSPNDIDTAIQSLPACNGPVKVNERLEYGKQYQEQQRQQEAIELWEKVETEFTPPIESRREIVLLGSAGDRVISAGMLMAQAAVMAGLHVTQKNEYNITVMRGPSVAELIISPSPILFTGIEQPDMIVCLSQEGSRKRSDIISKASRKCSVIKATDVVIPPTEGAIVEMDFKAHGIKKTERTLAAVSLLAINKDPITLPMLEAALRYTLKGKSLQQALTLVGKFKMLFRQQSTI